MPALALPSLGAAIMFLAAYCFGTVIAMSAATTLIGEGSLRVGESLDRVRAPEFGNRLGYCTFIREGSNF